MTPLERHIKLVSGFAARHAEQQDLAPLMEANVAPGQRALVYRNSGMLAGVEALHSNYRRLAALMGTNAFRDMARAFVALHPPERRSLVGYGEALASFIVAHVDDHAMPWLADFARLDRGWLEAHLAADAPTITAADVAHLGEGELMATNFQPHPSLRIVETGFDLWPVWSDFDQGRAPQGQVLITERPTACLFWRPGHEVSAAPLSVGSNAFLKTLIDGQMLGQACEAAITAEPGAELSAIIAFTFQSGLLMAGTARGGRNHDDH